MSVPGDDPALRRITHAELVHRPGERALAARVLELLGCRVVDSGRHWFSAFVEPSVADWRTNLLYASEATPAQWAFERSLAGALAAGGDLARDAEAWRADLGRRPQYSCHIGLRLPSEAARDAAVAAVREAGANDPELAGRIDVTGVFRPGDPDAATDTMVQAFVRTDVIACGLLTFDQHIELQWHLP